LERFIPFTELLPMTDLLITNGGYGGVQMSLAYGVPLVVAGLSEDKMEVNTRVKWSGTGISLDTWRPAPSRIRDAARKVLSTPSYRARALEYKDAYTRYNGARKAAEVIIETAGLPPHRVHTA
ncbi:MAG: glycosyl transferase, UDP-glucuronosyltransferase, partial [Actinomadura rubrobrunea]|nr:glycosyl transferase, UDP-glucuronosyltransferase [Actinomadura rubrobrunea]